MTSKSKADEQLYGIGAVARLTGLTDHTIRVWERRYDAVVARRAKNGRRMYSAADAEKLGLLKHLTDLGLSIGQIAGDSVDELRERAESLTGFAGAVVPDRIDIAVFGDFLPNQFAAYSGDLGPVQLLVADNNRDRFVADLRRHRIDLVVLESPILNDKAINELLDYMAQANAARGVLVYSFGRSPDVDRARGSRIVTLRSPVELDEVLAAVVRAHSSSPVPKPRMKERPGSGATAWDFSGPVAARRFTSLQLANLASAATAIDCECPRHLAQLVADLTAFEVYSDNCANRDEKDAALHRYLHQTTAQARTLIEAALERVAAAEGIRY